MRTGSQGQKEVRKGAETLVIVQMPRHFVVRLTIQFTLITSQSSLLSSDIGTLSEHTHTQRERDTHIHHVGARTQCSADCLWLRGPSSNPEDNTAKKKVAGNFHKRLCHLYSFSLSSFPFRAVRGTCLFAFSCMPMGVGQNQLAHPSIYYFSHSLQVSQVFASEYPDKSTCLPCCCWFEASA